MAGPAPLAAVELLHAELAKVVNAGASLATRAPPPWAALLVGVGVLFLLHGARHRVVLALPGGAVVGLLAARAFVAAMDGPGSAVQRELLLVAAGGGALLCAGWPPIFPALALALPGAVAGAILSPVGGALPGAVVGGLAGAAIGAALREWVASMAAGGIGGAAVIGGALGLLAKRAISVELLAHPMAILAVWAVLAVAGAAFHAGRAWPRPRSASAEGQGLGRPPERSAWDAPGADR